MAQFFVTVYMMIYAFGAITLARGIYKFIKTKKQKVKNSLHDNEIERRKNNILSKHTMTRDDFNFMCKHYGTDFTTWRK